MLSFVVVNILNASRILCLYCSKPSVIRFHDLIGGLRLVGKYPRFNVLVDLRNLNWGMWSVTNHRES
jgi:hypothetical protein